MSKIAVIYHSKNGHTKVLAEHIAIGAKELAGEVRLINCLDSIDFNYLDNCDAMVFGSPTYLGSVSAEMKAFMDGTSLAYSKQKWRNKIAAGFTNSSAFSGDKLNTLVQISLFAFQHGMIWIGLDLPAGIYSSKHTDERLNRVGSWIGLMSQSNDDQGPEISPLSSDRKTAEYFGKRIAEFAKKLEK
jgi:multimeric flavodoxin WrbA